jgi:hypothetical protein
LPSFASFPTSSSISFGLYLIQVGFDGLSSFFEPEFPLPLECIFAMLYSPSKNAMRRQHKEGIPALSLEQSGFQ